MKKEGVFWWKKKIYMYIYIFFFVSKSYLDTYNSEDCLVFTRPGLNIAREDNKKGKPKSNRFFKAM